MVIKLNFDFSNEKKISDGLNNFSYDILAVKKKSDEIISNIITAWSDYAADKFYMQYNEISSRLYRASLMICDIEKEFLALSKKRADNQMPSEDNEPYEMSEGSISNSKT